MWYFGFLFGETISHFPDISLLHRLENHSRFPLNCSADIVTVGLRSPLTVQRSQVFVCLTARTDILATRRKAALMSHLGRPISRATDSADEEERPHPSGGCFESVTRSPVDVGPLRHQPEVFDSSRSVTFERQQGAEHSPLQLVEITSSSGEDKIV